MEKEILEADIAEGLSIRAIALKRGKSRTTVRNYLRKYQIQTKLGPGSRGNKWANDKLVEQSNCVPNMCKYCEKSWTYRNQGRYCMACRMKITRFRLKILAVQYLGSKCNRCDWTGDVNGFDFHHLKDKDDGVSNMIANNRRWDAIEEELDKCELLCCFCHRMEHTVTKNSKFISHVIAYDAVAKHKIHEETVASLLMRESSSGKNRTSDHGR